MKRVAWWWGLFICLPAFGTTIQDKAMYDNAVAKAKLDRDFVIRIECPKFVTQKERQDCVKRVDGYYRDAVKGFKKQYGIEQ